MSQRRYQGQRRLGRTGDPVQGSSDWLDVLSTTSVVGGFELLDEMRALWGCAVDIHKVERRVSSKSEVKGGAACAIVNRVDYGTLIGPRSQAASPTPFLLPRATTLLVALPPISPLPTIPPALSHSHPN